MALKDIFSTIDRMTDGKPDDSQTAGDSATDDAEPTSDPEATNDPEATEDGTTSGSEASSSEDQAESEVQTTSEWSAAESPTTKSLFGVVQTANGPYAVGTGGNVLTRNDGAWHFAIQDGPATRKNTLTDVAVTDDGKRIWFAGSSGALGAYDVTVGKKYDYSAPMEKTSTWEAIAVTGKRGSEELRVANGSGEVLTVTTDENGCPQWGEVVKPGSGSTVPALDYGGGNFYAVDTSGNAFVEREKGWKDIGVRNAQVNFFDVYATEKTVLIAGGGGRIYRYDSVCKNWTPVSAGEVALHAIAGTDGADGTVTTVGAGGHVYERGGKRGWVESETPVEDNLNSVTLGETDVAVGAGGVIVER